MSAIYVNIGKPQELPVYYYTTLSNLSPGNKTMNNSAPPSKKAVSAFQILCKLLSFTLKDSWTDKQTINALPLLKTVSITLNNEHTTFYNSSGLTRNVMFNGSISYVLYNEILHFYLLRQYQRCGELKRLTFNCR